MTAVDLSWGLLVAAHLLLTSSAVGGFIVSFPSLVRGRASASRARPLIVSFASLLASPLPLLVDAGRPERAANLYIYSNPSSPIALYGYLFMAATILFAACAYLLLRGRKVERLFRPAALALLPAVLLLLVYAGLLFGSASPGPLWGAPLFHIAYIAFSLASGSAVILTACPRSSGTAHLPRLLALLLAAELALTAVLLATAGERAYSMPLRGALFVQFGIGGVLPLLILVSPSARESGAMRFLGGGLVLAGSFAGAWLFVVAGQPALWAETPGALPPVSGYEAAGVLFSFAAAYLGYAVLGALGRRRARVPAHDAG